MLGKLITLAIIIGACYWYWSGPYQQRVNPSYEKRLEQNEENMRQCIHGLNYKAGATGDVSGNPEDICAGRFNLYKQGGRWHSYEDDRPEK